MTRFSGVWMPLVSPFHNGKIDFPALKATARNLIAARISGLVTCATTGEAFKLLNRPPESFELRFRAMRNTGT